MGETKELVTFTEMKDLAQSVARSGLFQAFKSPEQAFVLMMLAQAEGCHPIQATQRYDVIQGKPAKKSDAMLADFQQRGGTITWVEYTDEAVEAEFTSKGMAKPCRVKWTYKMATEAGLTGKPTWKQFRRQMLKARVISEGVRISDPGVVAGLYTPEEVSDFDAPAPKQSQYRETRISEPFEAEVVPPAQAQPETNPKASRDQVKALCAAMNNAGIKDRDEVLAWCETQVGIAKGLLKSRNELTSDECSYCIKAAKAISMAPKTGEQE